MLSTIRNTLRAVERTRPLALTAALTFTAILLTAPAANAVTNADGTNTSTQSTVTSTGTTGTSGSETSKEGWVVKTNAKGVPYLDSVTQLPAAPTKLLAQLAKSGEIEAAYIDDKLRTGVFRTVGGAYFTSSYTRAPEELELLLNAGITPVFVTLERSPVPVGVNRDGEKGGSSNTMVFLSLLPLIIVIGGMALIYEKRQSDKRGPAIPEDETAFQTREGPAGSIPTVTFEDVAGCNEAIEDLSELVEFLKSPERFERLGAKIPRGALLVGPPGTGKTLLARAVAGEAKVPFFAASGSDFVEMYVGVGPARVRELFTKARAAEKAIVFIDEIDAVARARVMSTKQNANDERENTLNALLNELDGFSRTNVILIAATNRADILDPAILRPGRLDRKIQVPNPDRLGREKILAVHVGEKPLAKDVDLAAIARRTPGMSGADLAQIANEAAIEAARRNLKAVDASCFSSAVALVAMGRARKSALVTDRDRLITAYHEAGHTICALMHPDAENPAGVSITPRGHAGGITWMNGSDNQFLSRPTAEAQLVVALGGRAGEELLLDGEFTQGPSSDLERATQLATVMATRYGMTRRGLAVRAGEPDSVTHDVIEEMLEKALVHARTLLAENQTLFMMIVNQLLEHDTLEATDLDDIVASLQSSPSKKQRGIASRALAEAATTTVDVITKPIRSVKAHLHQDQQSDTSAEPATRPKRKKVAKTATTDNPANETVSGKLAKSGKLKAKEPATPKKQGTARSKPARRAGASSKRQISEA